MRRWGASSPLAGRGFIARRVFLEAFPDEMPRGARILLDVVDSGRRVHDPHRGEALFRVASESGAGSSRSTLALGRAFLGIILPRGR